ncbi:mobilome CxxCx(11)CxxC protein [Vreelandella sp. TE19]
MSWIKKNIIDSCREKEFHAYGTIRIFEKRARNLQVRRTWITFLGIVIPLVVGSIVLAFGTLTAALPYLLTFAGVVSTIQLILSTWSIVSRWDEKYDYAIESVRDNTYLYNKFKALAERPPNDLDVKFFELTKENERRESADITKHITDKEKRYANYLSLKYYNKPCHVCNEIPKTSKPSKCDGCGNF